MKKSDFFSFFKSNLLIFVLFFVSTILLFFYHYKNFSWDFASYILNAKYLFYGGDYFELLRPPIMPTILGLFLYLGKLSEYIFILVSSAIYFVANIMLADVLFKNYKIRKETARFVFYFFGLSIYVMLYGILAGTELISISFLMLFLAFVLKKKVSGHFLALGMLARYNLFIFSPFLFFSKNYKTILKNVGLVFLIFMPWLLFNYVNYGNFFASIIDSMTLNILNRGYLVQPFTFEPVLLIIGGALPLFLLGIFVSIGDIMKSSKKRYFNIVFWIVGILVLYDFVTNPEKKIRFLFNFVLIVSYFSSLGLFFIADRVKNSEKFQKYLVNGFFILFIFTSIVFFILVFGMNQTNSFNLAAQDIDNLGMSDCEILSPHWVQVTYYSGNVYPLHDQPIQEMVESNRTVLIFKNLEVIDFSQDDLRHLEKYVYYETSDYVFYSNGPEECSPKYIYNKPYTNYVFCPNIARRFEQFGLKETIENLCFKFNKN